AEERAGCGALRNRRTLAADGTGSEPGAAFALTGCFGVDRAGASGAACAGGCGLSGERANGQRQNDAGRDYGMAEESSDSHGFVPATLHVITAKSNQKEVVSGQATTFVSKGTDRYSEEAGIT